MIILKIYQKEKDLIIANNRDLHNQVENTKIEYKEKELDVEWKYKSKIKSLEKENSKLNGIIDKFHETIGKFISWICKKFDMGAEDNLIRDLIIAIHRFSCGLLYDTYTMLLQ